tara:strand:+ start:2925 stop:3962 length:1038 start_codon:yes stop_codon:yes gene_type:complete
MNSYTKKNAKVLIVSNQIPNEKKGFLSPFVIDQANSIEKLGYKMIVFDCNPSNQFLLFALVDFIGRFKNILLSTKPDMIHIHCGGLWSYFVCLLSKKTPLIITFHGSEILINYKVAKSLLLNSLKNLKMVIKYFLVKLFSYLSLQYVDFVILVTEKQKSITLKNKRFEIIPCGVDLKIFYPKDRILSIKKLKLQIKKHYILFISPQRPIKNFELARKSIELVKKKIPNVEFLFSENVNNHDMIYYYNAASLLLITSISEGSPVMVKEAMACNTPIVSVDVGDIKDTLQSQNNFFIGPYDEKILSDNIIDVLKSQVAIKSRDAIKVNSMKNTAKQISNIYNKMIEN